MSTYYPVYLVIVFIANFSGWGRFSHVFRIFIRYLLDICATFINRLVEDVDFAAPYLYRQPVSSIRIIAHAVTRLTTYLLLKYEDSVFDKPKKHSNNNNISNNNS